MRSSSLERTRCSKEAHFGVEPGSQQIYQLGGVAARLQRLASGKRAVDPWPTDRGRQRSAGGNHHEGQGDDVLFCCDGVKKGVHASQDARAERHCERRGERGWSRRLGYPLDICRWQIQMIFGTNYAFYHLLFPHGASDVAAVDTSPTPSSSL